MESLLLHIFDKSACLTCRQMSNYINGAMAPEECHAAEHHLNGCSLCSEALDGLQQFQTDASAVLAQLNSKFIHQHLNHLNKDTAPEPVKIAPPVSADTNKPVPKALLLVGVIAAAILLFAYFDWRDVTNSLKNRKTNTGNVQLNAITPVLPAHDSILPTPSPKAVTTHPHKKALPKLNATKKKLKKTKIILKYDDDFAGDTPLFKPAKETNGVNNSR